MSRTRGFGSAWLGAGVLVFACATNGERDDPVTCLGESCYMPGHVGSTPGDGNGDGNSGGGEGGESGAVTLSGVVGLLSDDEFHDADLFVDAVDLRAESHDGSKASAVWTGSASDPFEIEGVKQSRATWVYGAPRGSGNDALPTLEPMRTDEPASNGVVKAEDPFVLARASVLDQIFDVLSTPITRDSSKAQLVLKLVTDDDPPRGAEGVRVTAPKAEVVIYAVNGSFSEIPEETDSTGLVLLANVDASSWPGAIVDVSLEGDRSSAVDVRAITGAVTIVSVAP